LGVLPDAQSHSSCGGAAVRRCPAAGDWQAQRRYTRRINFREKWRDYLWQGRFASFVMDEAYLLAAVRYVELNPARAYVVTDAADWRWSSAQAHLWGRDDRLVKVAPRLLMAHDWRALLDSAKGEEDLKPLREHARTGHRLGGTAFIESLEKTVGRILRPGKPGRKPKLSNSQNEFVSPAFGTIRAFSHGGLFLDHSRKRIE